MRKETQDILDKLVLIPDEVHKNKYLAFKARIKTMMKEEDFKYPDAFSLASTDFFHLVTTVQSTEGLVDEGTFSSESCGIVQSVNWVASQLGIKDPDPASAPSPFAYAMYLWAKDNADGFWVGFAAKLIPSRTSLEDSDKLSDDGRDLLNLINEVVRMARESRKEPQ